MKLKNQVLEQQVKIESFRFGLERFGSDPNLLNFYTGFKDYKMLKDFYLGLESHAKVMTTWKQKQRGSLSTATFPKSEKTGLIDQLFMFLCRIKLGLFEQDLAVRFDISIATVSRILITWSNFLYVMLGALPSWPSIQAVKSRMPDRFKDAYPNTHVILDCTEIRVQTPSSKVLHSEIYSHYKSHTTLKGLFGITPDGSVSFVSSLFTGSISDIEITKRSGILDLLEEGDQVMVDKGFPIQSVLDDKKCSLVMPPFLRCNDQFTKDQVTETQKIARLRIHVERAIRRVKEYHIFDAVIPLTLSGSINQIWTICCLLTNFRGPLYEAVKKN